MRPFDFAPLYRATVGFDQIADLIERALTSESSKTTFRNYNIEKKADETHRILVAVAGFSTNDIFVAVKENAHLLAENKPEIGDTGSYLHSGIAMRSCERHFQSADHVQVVSASHIDGMLHVDLKSEVTEALKARRIDILQLQGNGIAETAVN